MIGLPAPAQNLYPDPGFEGTGVTGVVHSGERAGHLAVTNRNHWDSLGGPLQVQPFARYRVTVWAKARVGAGTFYAPFCYDWDSYEWAFVAQNTVAPGKDWIRGEVTFVSPHSTMVVLPLAYQDSENSEGWVDDVVVQKIASPDEVIAELRAKTNPTEDEKRLLVRWYTGHGLSQDAAALLDRSDGPARADIATVLAQHASNPIDRRRFLVEAAAAGGPTYHDGITRFWEMTRGMSDSERLQIVSEAVRRNPGLDRAGRSFRLVAENILEDTSGLPLTVGEAMDRLSMVRAPLQAALAAIPADSPSASELKGTAGVIKNAGEKLQERQQELGRCQVRIGGQVVAPSTHAIILPDTPTPQETYAARELQYHLELITGGVIPIRPQHQAGSAIPLYVGRCQRVKPRALQVNLTGLGEEGLQVRTSGPAAIFAGNKRGVLFAVYSFLESDLGCRWFTPDCATWPREGIINVPALNRRYIPPLEYRGGDYPVARPGAFAVRCRLNGSNHGQSEEQGGKVGVHSLAHTFASLVPPEKYFKDHPEYFSLVNGQRQPGYAQLCLANADVLRLVIAGVRKWIKENPGQTVFSVSQNDTDMHCECANCAAVAREEGSQSGPMLRFVNAVADDIRHDYPQVSIETLAYQYTRKPPLLTKPRPNVIVCLCSIECCFSHPISQDPFNHSFVEDIGGWSKICGRLWIWDYIINYSHSISPFPNLYVLQPNINFFLKNGVKGIYEESCYYTKGSELQELRNYIMAKTLWDPSTNTNQAINEFCAAYYGAAAPSVRSYINLIHQVTRNSNIHVRINTPPRDYITPEMITDAQALFDTAETAVKDDPVKLHRVQVARLPILYAEITLARSGVWIEHDGELLQKGSADVGPLADEFERTARAEGVTMVREGGPDASLDAWLKSIPRRPAAAPIERLHNPAMTVEALPALGGRIWRMTTPTHEILLRSGTSAGWNPEEGGYEEYSESGYRSPGWQEPYLVKDHSDHAITLEASLGNGIRLARTIELDPERPLLKITSTLTNISHTARTACLRIHPEFGVSSTDHATVRIRRNDGTWREVKLADPADPNAEHSEWLRGADLPNGAWAVVDGDTAVVNRLKPEQVGQCLLNWSGAQKRVNLEIYSPERSLAPGESLVIEQGCEVVDPGTVR